MTFYKGKYMIALHIPSPNIKTAWDTLGPYNYFEYMDGQWKFLPRTLYLFVIVDETIYDNYELFRKISLNNHRILWNFILLEKLYGAKILYNGTKVMALIYEP
jgi:hypothetical protein